MGEGARETGRQTVRQKETQRRRRWPASQKHTERNRETDSQAETDRDVNNLAIQFACKTGNVTNIHKLRPLGKSCRKLPSKTHKTL